MLPIPVTVNAPPTFSVELSIAAPSQCSSRVHVTSRPWMSPEAVTLAIESAEVALTAAFAPSDIRVMMSTLLRYKGPAIKALEPQIMLPLISTDGALTAQLNVALLLLSPSRSTLFESAKRSV